MLVTFKQAQSTKELAIETSHVVNIIENTTRETLVFVVGQAQPLRVLSTFEEAVSKLSEST